VPVAVLSVAASLALPSWKPHNQKGFLFLLFMAYFSGVVHFSNYFKKYFRDIARPYDKAFAIALTRFWEWSENYTQGKGAEAFTWENRERISEVQPEDFTQFSINYTEYERQRVEVGYWSEEFIEKVLGAGEPWGCYILYDSAGQVAYIGKAEDLCCRVPTSIKERRKKADITHVRLIETVSITDTSIVEAYLIGVMKPYLNSQMAYNDPVMVQVLGIPDASELISIFK
jgi:hypothetical protein